ncbi:hypothetical protein Tco_0748012 [Tanacetum coccineum]|uniref:Uncharacterized protein n=1 Tax=Tanacetum coccineum TaxID=301880 RepID=A0ABQ4YVA9_9ASTR
MRCGGAFENAFSGILTGVPKSGGGEFGKFYNLPALNDLRVVCQLWLTHMYSGYLIKVLLINGSIMVVIMSSTVCASSAIASVAFSSQKTGSIVGSAKASFVSGKKLRLSKLGSAPIRFTVLWNRVRCG